MSKTENIIPVGKQEFAYQCEDVSTICVIDGSVPSRSGKEPYPNDEADKYGKYRLVISRFTGKSVTVTLYKIRTDIVEQRTKNGHAVLRDGFQVTMSFAELVNQIFRDKEPYQFVDEEHLPDSIKEAMKTVYKREP